jgi:hypothetical protein
VSVLQQLVLAASACVQTQHVPVTDALHQPRPDVVYSQALLAIGQTTEVPIEIELLRGKRAGGRPLLGETPVATAVVKAGGVSLQVPGQPAVTLAEACRPLAAPGRR